MTYKEYLEKSGTAHSEIAQTEFRKLQELDYKCEFCHKDFREAWAPDVRIDKEGQLLCDDCYYNEYYDTCPACEAGFNKQEADKYPAFYLQEDLGYLGKGLYAAVRLPVFISDRLMDLRIFTENVKYLCSIEEFEREAGFTIPEYGAEFICDECKAAAEAITTTARQKKNAKHPIKQE